METVKKSWAFCLGLLPVLAMAQNVGVGTTNPEVRLHVAGGNLWVDNPLNNTSVVYLRSGTQNGLLVDAHSTGTATIGRLRPVQGGNTGPGLSIRQNSYVGMGLPGEPQYPLHIHATADQLSTAGIAFTHSALGTDPNTGMKIGLQMLSDATLQYGFLQWPGGMPFYFFQGNFLRMSMEPTGNISIGATLAEARLHVRSDANGASAMIVENRQIGGGVPKALTAIVRDALGVGIETRAENADGSAAPIELTATAIRAAAGNNRNAVSAYATNGVAVRARASSNDGYALHTMGKIKLEGNGGAPQNGRVLTTDGLGNATWQDLPTPIVTRLDNNLNYFSLSPDGIGTLYGSHLLVRTGIAPAPITNPAPSDGDYFFWNANRGALRAGQYFFSQLRHDSIGRYSMALGQRVLAKNDNTIVLGKDARAVANLSHAYGNDVEARSFREMVLGSFNELTTPLNTTGWNANDKLISVGNGTSNDARSNALVMLKNGNTGLGINNPVAPMHINSRLVIDRPQATGTASVEWRSEGTYRGGMGWDAGAGRFFFYDGESNTNTLFINNGRMGIQRDPTTNALEVNGNASKNTAGDWLANSDARLKTAITPISDALQKLVQLQGITYQWADDKTGMERPTGLHMGFTAQNVQQVFPELVVPDAQGYLQTAYGTYDALYVEAIKELLKKIESLEAKLNALEKNKIPALPNHKQ